MLTILLGAIFFAIAGIIVGAYLFLNRRHLAEAEAVRARLHGEEDAAGPRSILKDDTVSQVPFLDALLKGRVVTDTIQARLDRGGVAQKPGVFLLTIAVAGVVGLAIGLRYGVLTGALLLGAGAAAPWLWLTWKGNKRLAAFEAQLPEALDMMANAMKAGYSFQAAARFISEEVSEPLGPEFGRFYDEQRLGMEVRSALMGMQERTDSLNLKMFVTAVLIQRETGGNLTELLTNLSTLMRERVALKGQIDTLAAEPKLSGRFLAAIPVIVFIMLGVMNPGFVTPFRTSTLGHVLLAGAAISVVIGYMIMMAMARIDV